MGGNRAKNSSIRPGGNGVVVVVVVVVVAVLIAVMAVVTVALVVRSFISGGGAWLGGIMDRDGD